MADNESILEDGYWHILGVKRPYTEIFDHISVKNDLQSLNSQAVLAGLSHPTEGCIDLGLICLKLSRALKESSKISPWLPSCKGLVGDLSTLHNPSGAVEASVRDLYTLT